MVIESPRGKVHQRAQLFEGMDPRIVAAQHAWWFPEKKDPGHGWDESNINILTDNAYTNCDPAMGATHIRSLLCRIYPERKAWGRVLKEYADERGGYFALDALKGYRGNGTRPGGCPSVSMVRDVRPASPRPGPGVMLKPSTGQRTGRKTPSPHV